MKVSVEENLCELGASVVNGFPWESAKNPKRKCREKSAASDTLLRCF
jgi:hypothetical protein